MPLFQPGDLIGGRYRLSRIIGAGAMGTVWSARNESTDRDFALKLMMPDAAKNPIALQRFFQEAKASGRLRHRCIVEVYDLGGIDQDLSKTQPDAVAPYLVMELLEGEPLDAVLKRRKMLPIGTALRLVRDVARGLDVAHKQGIVHRDLKPANLYLHKSLEGTIVPKILDFGVSKLVGPQFDAIATSAGTVLGSPAYMSPEQAAGEVDVDGRSDVWSLGVILYKCLVGHAPFTAPNYNALMVTIAKTPHKPLEGRVEGMPRELDALMNKCLAKTRADRFASAKALADDIDRLLQAHPNLWTVDLTDIVNAPVELTPSDARLLLNTGERTAAVDQGTLVATELAQNTRLMSPTVQRPSVEISGTESSIVEPKPGVSRRARVAASIMGVALFVGLVMLVSRRPETAPVSASAPTVAVPVVPEAVAPTPAAAPTPTPGAANTSIAAGTATNTASTSAPAEPAPQPTVKKPAAKPVVKAAPKTTATPAHEGVTGAGF